MSATSSDDLLGPVRRVVAAALAVTDGLVVSDIMLVGAWCRDYWHQVLGHTFPTSATRDLDLALALSSWDAYGALSRSFPRASENGIGFLIAQLPVDLIPFGGIENPSGVSRPPSRGENHPPLSVWAFEEIFKHSLPLVLTGTRAIRVPTVPGYAAAKLGAWLDRAEWHEAKDANDLALVLHWYSESTEIQDRIYGEPDGQIVLERERFDLGLATAHLLGRDIAQLLGAQRTSELTRRWPGKKELLLRELTFVGAPTTNTRDRRAELITALTRGLESNPQIKRGDDPPY